MNWIKKHKIDFVLIFISVITMILTSDVILFFTHYRGLISLWNYPRYYFQKDEELGFIISNNFATSTHFFPDAKFQVWSNNIGCFDTNYASETPYIYMTGDSLTWSFVPFNESWGKQIQDIIGIRTLKCGVVGGYGTKQELLRTTRDLEKLPLPQLITVGYTQANDTEDDAAFPNVTVYKGYLVRNLAKDSRNPSKGGLTNIEAKAKYENFVKYCTLDTPPNIFMQKIRCFLNTYSVLYNLVKKDLRDKLVSIFPESKLVSLGLVQIQKNFPNLESDEEYKKHLDNILNFKKLAEKKGVNLLFVLYLVPGSKEQIKEFLQVNNIEYIDVSPYFQNNLGIKPLIWPKDGHWNIAGNHLVADIVSRYILEHNLVSVPDKRKLLGNIKDKLINEFGTSTALY